MSVSQINKVRRNVSDVREGPDVICPFNLYLPAMQTSSIINTDVTSQQNLMSDDRRHQIHIRHYSQYNIDVDVTK